MAGGELRSQQPVFFVDVRVVVATGEVVVRCANLGRVLGDVRVDPAVVVLLLQLPAAVHHFPRAAHSEARRDGVKIPSLTVVALDQALRLAVEFIRCDEEVVGRKTVDSGQASDHAHITPSRLVEKLLRRDRAAGGERQACRRAPGQEGVEEVPGQRSARSHGRGISILLERSRFAANQATGYRTPPRTRTCGK